MPTNSSNSSSQQCFDIFDEDSWFFGFMSRADASELLTESNEVGAFLVRESTTELGNLVLSVKENDNKVSHYIINKISPIDKNQQVCFKIGDQMFSDMPSLLDFYQQNNLNDTPLRVPAVQNSLSKQKRSFTKDYLAGIEPDSIRYGSVERTPTKSQNTKMVLPSLQRKLPGIAKVIQSRVPNAYDKTALTLRQGEIITVTKVDINGCWEGEISGKKGHFPFNYVKFIEDN